MQLASSPHAAELQVAAAFAGGAAGTCSDSGADWERLHEHIHLCQEQVILVLLPM